MRALGTKLLAVGFPYLLAGSAALGLSACVTAGITIVTPGSGATVSCAAPPQCPVPVHVEWIGGQINGPPTLSLDNAAVPNALAFPPGGTKGADGTLTMAPGAHSITVYATLTDGASIKNYSATANFTVATGVAPPPPPGGGSGSLTIALQPSTLAIERGKFGTTNVTVSRGGGFTGDVKISVSSLPAGVTANPLTILAAASAGVLQINVASAAGFAQGNLKVSATGPNGAPASPDVPLTVTVARAAGAFVEASPAPYANSTIGNTVTSLSTTFAADIKSGTQLALPQPRGAQFRKGTMSIGPALGFTLGTQSNLGGAGFCKDNGTQPTRTRGVVMTSAPVGSNAQYGFSFVDLMGNPAVIRQMDANGSKTNPTVIAPPKVYFSPDCSLALVAGVNTLGPSSYVVTVLDLESGTSPAGSCGWPVQFNVANSFSAVVKLQGTASKVEVTVDPGAATAQTCTFNVP
jgi:hypothetical protein